MFAKFIKLILLRWANIKLKCCIVWEIIYAIKMLFSSFNDVNMFLSNSFLPVKPLPFSKKYSSNPAPRIFFYIILYPANY